MKNKPTLRPYSERVSIVAEALVKASAAATAKSLAETKATDETRQVQTAAAAASIPLVLMEHRTLLGVREAPEERLTFAMMAVALGFVGQKLPTLIGSYESMAKFGRDIRVVFDAKLGIEHKAPAPLDDEQTVWALYFDEHGCGPTAVSLAPEVLDHLRRPGEPEPGPDDPLSRTIMLSVDISPGEAGWPQYADPGGYAMKVPAAERLIVKLREAIDSPRDPRLDAPSVEVG